MAGKTNMSLPFISFSWIEFRQREVEVNLLLVIKDILLELEYNLRFFRLGETVVPGISCKNMSKELKELKIKKSFEQIIDLVVKMKKVFVKGQSQDIF